MMDDEEGLHRKIIIEDIVMAVKNELLKGSVLMFSDVMEVYDERLAEFGKKDGRDRRSKRRFILKNATKYQ